VLLSVGFSGDIAIANELTRLGLNEPVRAVMARNATRAPQSLNMAFMGLVGHARTLAGEWSGPSQGGALGSVLAS
jgi:hypothetical protein